MITIIDYDAGNIKSVEKAIISLGEDVLLTNDTDKILSSDGVILPGVGSFGEAMKRLNELKLTDCIRKVAEKNIPLLGICLGQQLLFESSEESPGIPGIGILKGKIKRIPDTGLKIPHIGWNDLSFPNPGRLFKGVAEGSYVYFVHSYYLEADDPGIVTATTEYGTTIQASVECGNVFATQFHPEKSSDTGLKMLSNFIEIVKA